MFRSFTMLDLLISVAAKAAMASMMMAMVSSTRTSSVHSVVRSVCAPRVAEASVIFSAKHQAAHLGVPVASFRSHVQMVLMKTVMACVTAPILTAPQHLRASRAMQA